MKFIVLLCIVVAVNAGKIINNLGDIEVCDFDGRLGSSLTDESGIIHTFYCDKKCRQYKDEWCIKEYARLPAKGEIKYICDAVKAKDCVKQFI